MSDLTGPLSDAARAQFADALGKEIKKDIDNKVGYFAVPAGLVAFGLLGQVSLLAGVIGGFIVAGMVWKVAEMAFEAKLLAPIYQYSDEMLVARYNEKKADRRAEKTRSTIWWAVGVVVVVIVLIALLANKH